MNNLNIKSGHDYAQSIIQMMIQTEKEVPDSEKTPEKLMNFWFEEIEILADSRWMEYILGKRETYRFNADEVMDLYNKANERYVQEILNGLVDKDLIQAGINENGEMMYKITEEGSEIVKKYQNGK